ncbi:MAG: alpha/beta hydrolase [Lachnospiraceae bacterium]|nr:alpha/beta hydrolase [Lachnospiraceae bacterium]
MKRTDLTFHTSDHKTPCTAVVFSSEGDTHTVLQIIPDLCEDPVRYEAFAASLAEKHIAAVVSSPSACDTEAVHALRQAAAERFPGVPYFMLGTGRGSYALRAYLASRGDGLNGAVLAGCGFVPEGTCLMRSVRLNALIRLHGEDYRCVLFPKMTRISVSASSGDDTLPSLREYRAYLRAVTFSCNETHIAELPKDLPVLLLSGTDDPAGDFGAGVRRVQEKMLLAGVADVSCKFYQGAGHDLLDAPCVSGYADDVCAFIGAHMDGKNLSSYDSNQAYNEKKAAAKKDYEIEQILL